jgi:hypothetical protein
MLCAPLVGLLAQHGHPPGQPRIHRPAALQRVRCAIASWAAVADLRAACRAAVRADFVVSVAALPPP